MLGNFWTHLISPVMLNVSSLQVTQQLSAGQTLRLVGPGHLSDVAMAPALLSDCIHKVSDLTKEPVPVLTCISVEKAPLLLSPSPTSACVIKFVSVNVRQGLFGQNREKDVKTCDTYKEL